MKLLNLIKSIILEVRNFRVLNFRDGNILVQVFQSAHQKDERNGGLRQLNYSQINQIINGDYKSGVPTNEILKSIKKNSSTIIKKFEELDKIQDVNRVIFIQEMPSDYPSDRIEYVLSGKFYRYPTETIVLTIITSAFSGQNSQKSFFKGQGQDKVFLSEEIYTENIPIVFLT
jgi:hypothetical protein